jgi:hypothetical protein
MNTANPDPLTRPAPADESAVAGHPLPPGGEGIFMIRGEPKDHEVFAQDDRRQFSHRFSRYAPRTKHRGAAPECAIETQGWS